MGQHDQPGRDAATPAEQAVAGAAGQDGAAPAGQGGQLAGRVAVITGGGRGIGRAIALRYAREGATVVISSRTGSDLAAVLDAARLGPDRGLAVVADAMDRADARRPVAAALERFGRIDILVNNVGGTLGNADPFAEGDAAAAAADEAFERTVLFCLTSAWWTSSAALRAMRAQGDGGRIISIGSGASKRTGGSVPYTAAKHGLVGLTRQLAAAAAPYGINVNLLCPGWTRTSLLDFDRIAARRGTTAAEEEARAAAESLQNRVLEADELAGMATLLAGPDGRGITGQVISVDGGYKV
ncbi:MAG: SDR family oxidoreductase [Frankia sp.]|nr:SDR family oxidoreductase [Frankia sp.]